MPEIERKLTTIFAADAVGYSRLMSEDEPGTLETLRSYREVMSQAIAQHRGRVVSAVGDGLLAEFASVVNAVECGIRIQREIAERNATLAKDRQMWFRIGINLGDVMVEGEDLLGDGVNVAARLQALAEPGGVLVSGPVFEQVRDKLAVGFDYLGPQSVKNIAAKVPAYRVLLKLGADAPAPPAAAATHPDADGARSWRPLALSAAWAGLMVLIVFVINLFTYSGVWWFKWPALAFLAMFAFRALRLLGRPAGNA